MPDSTSLSLRDAESDVCRQIREIMQVYREQAESSYGVDTPGGLEHMGDVWKLLRRWDEKLERAAPPSSPGAPQSRADDNLNSAVRQYRHAVHGMDCTCKDCTRLLKILVSDNYELSPPVADTEQK